MRFIFNVFLCFSIFISSLSFSSEGVIENTPISTPSGVKSIQDITTADTVISCDTSSMERRENKVLTSSTCIYTDVIKITTGAGRELSLALEQQVFIEAKGWLTGDKLELYDCLIDINGYQDYIVAIEPSEHKQPVYIFAVARDHNFYADGILVHNPGWGDLFGAVGGAIADAFVPDCEAKVKSVGFRGGAHKNTSKPVGDALDSHHLISTNSNPKADKGKAMAVQMEPHDHKKTSSYGPTTKAKEYRANIGGYVERGDMRNATAIEVRDVRNAAVKGSGEGNLTKYNGALKEALNYGKGAGILKPKK